MNDTRIGELRKERGWTQERLADESGRAVRTIQRLEAGSDANLDTVSMIAAALNVPVRELFTSVSNVEYAAAVDNLDQRVSTQQERRNAVTRDWRRLYFVVGTITTLAVLVGIRWDYLPTLAVLIIPVYWFGARVVSGLVFQLKIEPWLDKQYPLSNPAPTRRRKQDRLVN